MIIRIVNLTFQEHFINDFLKIFEESDSHILAFSGCNGVELVRDIHQPNVFFTISKWDNEAALENYRKSDFFGSTWAKIKPLFLVKAEAWSTVYTRTK